MSGASRGRSSFAEMTLPSLTKVFSDLEINLDLWQFRHLLNELDLCIVRKSCFVAQDRARANDGVSADMASFGQ
jgi:hypothetical protein